MTDQWSDWPAPAKLNLFLHIVGRREDGYHLLQTVFQLLDWGDNVRLRARQDGAIARVQGAHDVAPEADLAVRAAHALRAHAGVSAGVDIVVEKHIPVGAGLGGGSSDAATVLVALNELWGLHFEVEALAAIGLALGADVPVFVRGHSAWAEGIGERLTPLELPPRSYVVLNPGVHVPTAQLFQAPELTRNTARLTISDYLDGATTANDFTPLVRARYAAVDAALAWLGRFGDARLSGSGGSVFAAVEPAAAQEIARMCPPPFQAVAVCGVSSSPLHEALQRYRRGSAEKFASQA